MSEKQPSCTICTILNTARLYQTDDSLCTAYLAGSRKMHICTEHKDLLADLTSMFDEVEPVTGTTTESKLS